MHLLCRFNFVGLDNFDISRSSSSSTVLVNLCAAPPRVEHWQNHDVGLLLFYIRLNCIIQHTSGVDAQIHYITNTTFQRWSSVSFYSTIIKTQNHNIFHSLHGLLRIIDITIGTSHSSRVEKCFTILLTY